MTAIERLVKRLGLYDCPRLGCAARHELVSRPLRQIGARRHRCSSCGGSLRLVTVKRTMPEAVRRTLRARAEARP